MLSKTYFTNLIEENRSFETNRLKIFPLFLTEESFKDIFEIYSSESNVENYCECHKDVYISASYFKNKVDFYQNRFKSLLIYTIRHKEDNKIIGLRNIMRDIRPISEGRWEANFRDNIITEIIINQKYWNQGYAYEASDAIFSHLTEYNLSYALSFVNIDNLASYKLDKKLGFVEFSQETAVQKFGFFKECVNNSRDLLNKKVFVKGLSSFFPYSSSL